MDTQPHTAPAPACPPAQCDCWTYAVDESARRQRMQRDNAVLWGLLRLLIQEPRWERPGPHADDYNLVGSRDRLRFENVRRLPPCSCEQAAIFERMRAYILRDLEWHRWLPEDWQEQRRRMDLENSGLRVELGNVRQYVLSLMDLLVERGYKPTAYDHHMGWPEGWPSLPPEDGPAALLG